MCWDQFMHLYYTLCRRGQRGGPYHWFPCIWPHRCDTLLCGGTTFHDNPLVHWSSAACPGCEAGTTSSAFWQANGSPKYRIPKELQLDVIFAAPRAPNRPAPSIGASLPPTSLRSGASSTDDDEYQSNVSILSVPSESVGVSGAPYQANASASAPRSQPIPSASRTPMSQLAAGSRLLDTYMPNDGDNSFVDDHMYDMDDHINSFLIPVPEDGLYDASATQLGKMQSHQPSTHRPETHSQSTPRASIPSFEPPKATLLGIQSSAFTVTAPHAENAFNTPGTQPPVSKAAAPKTDAENTLRGPELQSHSSRAPPPTGISSSPQTQALENQTASVRKRKVVVEARQYPGQDMDPPKALRSGTRY